MESVKEVKNHYGKLKLLIGGKWVASTSTISFETTNPANEEVIAEYPQATSEEAAAAVEAAQKGFEAMKNIALRERA